MVFEKFFCKCLHSYSIALRVTLYRKCSVKCHVLTRLKWVRLKTQHLMTGIEGLEEFSCSVSLELCRPHHYG